MGEFFGRGRVEFWKSFGRLPPFTFTPVYVSLNNAFGKFKKGFVRGRLRSTKFAIVWGHFLDVILDLGAETLSESVFFNARSDHMGFRS